MKTKGVFLLIWIILSVQISQVASSVAITLTSSMTDTTEDTFQIKSNILTLTSDEEYIIKGSCSECGIEVKKGTSPSITLSSITIDNSNTGPFVIKKNCDVKLILEGKSTIIDKETDENAEDFEGASIKFKSGSTLTISGTGTLIVNGNIKNGIKGASGSNLIINSGILNVTCVNNGIAADGSVVINGGTFNVETSEGDGIKSDPDYNDTASEGSVTINDGIFNINSYNDGIQAKDKLIINGGTFNIKTFKDGSSATNFDKDLYSAKGIKVSTNETSVISMLITGGTFNLNTADDAVHSDGNITITGGTFLISTQDDGIHADQSLIIGKSGDSNNKVKINITKSLEGLEGAQIYIYSGIYNVISSDDGINTAGDTTDQCRQGNMPGGNMGPGGNMKRNLRGGNKRKLQQLQCNTFHMYFYGGEIYVNAGADGLDANGNIVISGGNLEIWGAKSGSDGDFVDVDGTMTISGGTFFGGGNVGMTNPNGWKNSQNKILGQNSVSVNGKVNIVSGSNTIKSYTAPKNIGYLYYTSPSVDSTYKFSLDSSSSSGTTTPEQNQGQGQQPGNNNFGPFQGNNGTMPGMPGQQPQQPGFGNNGSMPAMPPDFQGNNGTMPGMPGQQPQQPGFNNNGSMPGMPGQQPQQPGNGTMPGMPGQQPQQPGNGTMPGMPGQQPQQPGNGTMPGMPGQQPQQPGNGTMPGMPGQQPGFENNGTMPGMPPDQGSQNNGTMPGQEPGFGGNNGTTPETPGPKPGSEAEDEDDDDFIAFANGERFMKINSLYIIVMMLAIINF